MVSPRRRGLRPLSEDRYNLFVQLLRGTYDVPVKKRTPEHRKGIIQFWRVKKHLTFGVEGNKQILLHSGKKVLTTPEFEKAVLREAKDSMGAGARSVHYKMKRTITGSSERQVRKILSGSVSHSWANAKFTNKAPVQSMLSSKIFERLQIDLMDMRKEAVAYGGVEYSYILSVMDCFSRYTFLRPLSSKSPTEIVKCLEGIFLDNGCPSIVQCDNGTEFKGDLPPFLTKHNIKLIHSSPYHPQSQGKVERNNATVKRKLNYCLMRKGKGTNWVNCLPHVANAINDQPKEVLGYQTPFAVYYGRGPDSSGGDKIRRRAALASKRCVDRIQNSKFGASCSIYKPNETVLMRYPCRKRVPKKRSVLVAKVIRRNKGYSKYYVSFIDPVGTRKRAWVSVENITSLTVEKEKLRRQESRRAFRDKRQREEHRRKYYIALDPSADNENAEPIRGEIRASNRTRDDNPSIDRVEGQREDDKESFIQGVRVTFNPTKYGTCQFDALSHQLNSIGIHRTGDQLRQCAVLHLRQNKDLYLEFFRDERYFERYLQHMSRCTTYGDHFTLQAISREFLLQILVISKSGKGNHRLVSSSGIFDHDLPVITLGHYPEGLGEHYVSVICNDLRNFLPNKEVGQRTNGEEVNTPKGQNLEIENPYLSENSLPSPSASEDLQNRESTCLWPEGSEGSQPREKTPLRATGLEGLNAPDRQSTKRPKQNVSLHSDQTSAQSSTEPHSDIPFLPDLVLEQIIRCCIEIQPESLFRLQYVNRFFRHVVRTIGYPRVHINSSVMPRVPYPLCIRRIARKFGSHSGLICRLREIIQDRRFINAWLILVELDNDWFEIRNIYWRGRR